MPSLWIDRDVEIPEWSAATRIARLVCLGTIAGLVAALALVWSL